MPYNEIIEQLDHHLNQVIYLLKPAKKSFSLFNFKKNYLYEKSWTLVIGTPHAGKTAFLQQAELNLIQGHAEDNSDNCHVWYNPEGVFIELPSVSLENPEENTLLHHCLNTIKARRRKKPFDHILLMINMYEFIHEYDQYRLYLEKLKDQLQKTLSPFLPEKVDMYIVFTHMDKVAGFCDFFSEFSVQQATQSLGYLFDEYFSPKKLIAQHEKKFDRLLAQLHENLITLLHKTRNNLTRYLIREFPQQLDSLRGVIRSSLSTLSEIHEPHLKMSGVFFTSACQSGVCIDRITIPISQSYQLTVSNQFPQAYRKQSYFIKGVVQMMNLQHCANDTRFAQYRREHKRLSYVGYAAATLILLTIGIGYQYNIKHLNQAALALNQYHQLTQTEALTSIVPELHYLATARNTLNEMNSWLIPLKGLNKTKQWINKKYYEELSQQFLPQLAHQMEERLLRERNPALQYATLKAYLMLGEPQHLDIHYLKQWLNQSLNFSSEENLESSLLQPFPGIELNQSIIDQARNNLNTLPIGYLSYMLIKNNPADFVSIDNEAFQLSSQKMPVFYTKSGFEKEYTQKIPHFVQNLFNENWVLKNNTFSNNKNAVKKITNEIQKLYLSDYQNWWKLFIYHTQPKSFQTFDEAIIYFHLLKQASPLNKMLTFIQTNTSAFKKPNTIQQLFNTEIAATFNEINLLSPESIKMINPALNSLDQYFSQVSKSTEKSAMAFSATKQKFMNPEQQGALSKLTQIAKSMPVPAGQWLQTITENCWYLMISETKNYINQQWKKIVFPEYTQNIQNLFPINTASEKDVSLDNFNHFFNHQGTLNQFFQMYLSPFLNTEKASWELKQAEGFTLPLSSEMILAFERINVIREMFFAGNTTTAKANFIIQTTELQPVVGRITLNINGQMLVATQTEKSSQYFSWPGNYEQTPVSLSIQNITGEKFDVTEYGPWGLFHLLAHANIQPLDNDSRNLQLVFDLNGNAAEYLLKSNNPVNPFIPGFIQGFELPAEL